MRTALDYLNEVHKRRAIVFMLSDFHDTGYESAFRLAARKHDLIAVRVTDPRERTWLDVGLLRLQDAETGEQRLLDTSSRSFRERFEAESRARAEGVIRLARGAGVDLLEVSTEGGHLKALVRFFQLREKRQGKRSRT